MNPHLPLPPTSAAPVRSVFFGILSVLVLALALAPLLLTSRDMWDGVIGSYAIAKGDLPMLYGWLLDSNWYLSYALVRSAVALQAAADWPVWMTFKLWICMMILGIAWETASLARTLLSLPARTARWALLLVVSFPVWFVFFSYSSMAGHLTSVWLGLAGFRWLRSRRWAVAAGAAAVVVSFQLASNCTFLPMLALAFYMLQPQDRRGHGWRLAFVTASGVAVFLVTRLVWPPSGAYAGYNALLSPFALSSWKPYLTYTALFSTWLLLLLPAAAALWLSRAGTGHAVPASPASSGRFVLAALAGMLAASAAPYIGVGVGSPLVVPNLGGGSSLSAVMTSGPYAPLAGPWYGGWGARHMLLGLVPLTLLTLWLAQAAQMQAALSPTGGRRWLSVSAILGLCVVFNLCWIMPGHWAKLKRHGQEQALLNLLERTPAPPPGKVAILLPPDIDYLNLLYEANYLLFLAYGRDHWAAFAAPDRPEVLALVEDDRNRAMQRPAPMRALYARQNVMQGYDWNRHCASVLKVGLPPLSVTDVLWRAARAPEKIEAATILRQYSTCADGIAPWR